MANAIWQATIVDQSGNVLPGAEVEVINEATGLSAPLFKTRTGTAKSNPFFADANGFAQFYAAPGLYRITATSSGTGTTMTWRNVRLVDVATNAEAIAGTAGVLPDAAGVKAHYTEASKAELIKSTEAASNGRVTVRFTAKGQPCFFVKIPAFNCEDIAPGGELGTGLHPAFLFNGTPKPYILIGQYLSSVIDGEYVSQPNRIPDASKTYDQELALAAATGTGFKVLSNWDWAAVSLWCMANGFQPEGNTDWGRHHTSKWDTAIRYDGNAPGSNTGNGRTYTGTGPVKWNHNNHESGICDMVGNVWERVSGLKLIDDIFHIAPDNGTYAESQYTNTGVAAPTSGTFSTRGTTTSIPLQQALVFPANSALAPNGRFYKDETGERIPFRGGYWGYASNAGLGALYLYNARSFASGGFGSRLAFSE